jgi:hypothetical protein
MGLTGARKVEKRLNAVIADAVSVVSTGRNKSRIRYVDPNRTDSPFVGKYLCGGGVSDFNGVDLTHVAYSLHPNVLGHQDYKTIFKGAMR